MQPTPDRTIQPDVTYEETDLEERLAGAYQPFIRARRAGDVPFIEPCGPDGRDYGTRFHEGADVIAWLRRWKREPKPAPAVPLVVDGGNGSDKTGKAK